MKRILPVILFCMLALLACDEEVLSIEAQAEKDREDILNYLQENNLTAEEDPSGLFYIIEKPGSVARPDSFSTVTIHYKGELLNGDEFDTTYDNDVPLTINLQSTIRGWTIGIPFFKLKGGGTLLIPSGLAYGRQRRTGIPSNSVLIFKDIELVSFQ